DHGVPAGDARRPAGRRHRRAPDPVRARLERPRSESDGPGPARRGTQSPRGTGDAVWRPLSRRARLDVPAGSGSGPHPLPEASMRTRANFKSHPVHPALGPYPIAFLHGAFICDVAGRLTGRRRWWRAGRAVGVAGIAGALVAAVPGFIDYLFSVPPKSSGKRRATQHMLVNLGAVGLFSAAQWLRRGNRKPGLAALGAEAAGVGLLTSGAWMGGTLIHGNFIGPDHRYPESGRWSEEGFTAQPGETIAVARTGEFEAPGQMKLVRVNGRRIAIARTEDGYAAFDDHCTHR